MASGGETVGLAKPITVTVGVASSSQTATTWRDLVAAADVALYRAKALGRNRLVTYRLLGDER